MFLVVGQEELQRFEIALSAIIKLKTLMHKVIVE